MSRCAVARPASARMPLRPGPWRSQLRRVAGECRHRPRRQAVRRTACFAQILSAICRCRLPRCAGTGQWRLRTVSVVVAKPAHQRTVAAPWGLLPVFLPAPGGEVEPLVGAVDHVGAPRVAGVGVEDAVAAAQEGTEAVYLASPLLPVRSELITVPVVV